MEVRNKCIICGNGLELLHRFKSFPVYMGVSDNNIDNDVFSDMIWVICKNCGCIQLEKLIDLSVLYHKGHNSAYGKTWEYHHKKFSDVVSKYCGTSVLEIGGGNLKLANLVTDKRSDVKFTVIDSNCEKSNKQNIITKIEFFDYKNYNTEYEVDTIVHSHVLEHFYEPIKNIQMFAKILKKGQRMIMSVPLLDVMVNNNFTNGINFEHTYMLSEELLDFIVKKNGFKIIHKELFNPYNIFVVCEKTDVGTDIPINNLYEKNLSLFTNFINFHKDFINKVNEIDRNGFYVFGGHIFSQYLFMFGLSFSRCICILDNDPNKIDKRLYGTELYVRSPKILADVEIPVVVLRAAQFSDEIKNDIIKNINSKTIFIME